uniref:Arachidonate--CoA ligase n=1 Tax=Oreochromis niloticus TaxID=8128 RepID=A0A669FC57_ORENI
MEEFIQKLPDLDVSRYIRNMSTSVLISMGAVAAATTYYLATRPRPLPLVCDLQMQSVEVQGGDLARRSVLLTTDSPLTHIYDDATTLYEFFLRGARVSNNGPCVGSRKPKQSYEWISYREVIEQAENLGSAFLHKGNSKTADSHIGIFSQNRPEWTISELACYTYSLVSVPLYDTLGAEAIGYIIDKASISTIVCDVMDKVNLVLDCINNTKHSVRTIVLMESANTSLIERGQQAGIHILSLREMMAIGKANHQEPLLKDLSCLLYALSGKPKGAMLTHGNIVSNCSAGGWITHVNAFPLCLCACVFVFVLIALLPSDIHFSYLPLAHMFERVGVMLMHGARIGYFQGDIRRLSDDMKALKPTVFPVVPRLLNRMYDKVFGLANSPWKRWLLEFAFKRKHSEIMKGIIRKDSIWDKLIFNRVQASLGGCVRLMTTGAAPISPVVLTFLRAALGCQLYEGYGQTECTAGCTVTMPGDWTAGHVGAPLPCNTVKLVDVPEMNYLAENGEGENGTLKIVDRKKHIFKLAQGEYIAPEKIENIYMRSDAVAQVFVHGDSLQACLVAVVVPDPDFLSDWTKRTLGLQGSYLELCGRAEVKAAILEDMLRLGKAGGLKSFEQVKAICIHTELFSIENDLLTPTMKAKRNELRQYFRSQIDELYAGIKM